MTEKKQEKYTSMREKLIPMALEVYKNDCKIRYTIYQDKPQATGGKREKVFELSEKSIARLVFLVQNTHVVLRGMITLTYPSEFPMTGKLVKLHLNSFLSWAKKIAKIGNYVWFLEFQKRGAPHLHVLVENDISGQKRDVSRIWYGIVGSGDVKHLRAGTRTEKIRDVGGAGKYAAKYGAKKSQKTPPREFTDVGRFWGNSRGMKPEPETVVEVHDMKTIQDTLEGAGWAYTHLLESEGIGTLYNAAKSLRGEI